MPEGEAKSELDVSLQPAVCRFCLAGEKSITYFGDHGEPLVNYCNCKGATGLYHRSCIEHWLLVSRTTACDICRTKFILKKRYQSLWTYLKAVGCAQSSEEGRNMLPDLLCACAISPLAMGSVFLCTRSALSSYEKAQQQGGDYDQEYGPQSHLLEFTTFILVSIFLAGIYITWLLVTLVYHFAEFRCWQKRNYRLRILDPSVHRRPPVSLVIHPPTQSSSYTVSNTLSSSSSNTIHSSSSQFPHEDSNSISLTPISSSSSQSPSTSRSSH